MTRSFASMLALLHRRRGLRRRRRAARGRPRARGRMLVRRRRRGRDRPATRGDRLEPGRRPGRRRRVRDRRGVGPQADRDEPGRRRTRTSRSSSATARSPCASRAMLVVGLVGGAGAAEEVRVVAEAAGFGAETWVLARDAEEARDAPGTVSLIGGGAPSRGAPAAAPPPGPRARADPRPDPRLRSRRAPPPRAGRHHRPAMSDARPGDRDLRLADFRPRSVLRVPAHPVDRPRFPVIDAHNHLGSAFGGDWAGPIPGRARRRPRRGRHRDHRRPRRRPGRRPLARRSSAGARPADRVVVFAGLDYAMWATDPAFGETESQRLRDSAARGARGLKVWKLLGLRATDPGGRLVAVDDERLDPLWATAAELGPAGGHPHRRSRRVLRAARRDERALGGAARASGLALLADPARRPGRRPGRRRASRRSTSCWRPSDGSSPATRGRRSSARTWAVPRRTSASSAACSTRTRTCRSTSPRASASSAASRTATRAFMVRYADRILFGVDLAPDPAIYRLHYRFLETFDESFDYGTDPVPSQGRWQIHGIGPAGRRAAQGLRGERRAGPEARRWRGGPAMTGPAMAHRAPPPVHDLPVTYLLGTRRGLRACASERGTFAVLALDHRQNLRRELRPDAPETVTYDEMVEFKRAVVRALAPVATGTLLDPEIGAAQSIARRVDARAGRPHRGHRGDRLSRPGDRPGQPRARRLERREGQAAGRLGRQAPRLLPPGRAERGRPGALRRGRRRRPAARSTWPSSSSRSPSRSWPASA